MAILHEDPYRLTEVEGVGFARADKIALAADVPPESSRRAQAAAALRARRGRAAGQQLPAAGGAGAAHREADRPRSRPRGAASRRAGCWSTEGRVYRELDPRQRGRRAPRPWRARRGAAPPRPRSGRDAPERGAELTDEQWAAVRGAFARARLGPHRRPGVGKTACTRAIVAEAEAADATHRALRADRPRRPPARGGDRPRRADDPPPARVDAGARAGLQARPPAARRPGDRRRVLDAQPAPDRGPARRPRRDRPTSSSSATPTSCRRSAPASPSRT